MRDPYQVLGIERSATDREVKKAYRSMSRKYHPDSYTQESEKEWAEGKFREVQEAYNQIVAERSGKTTGYGGYGSGNTGGYGYAGNQEASEEDQHLMAAYNYIRARKFNEAINVLNGIPNRSARWYYFSSYANLGLGNNVVALDYAKRAVDMDPGNMEYRQYYAQVQQGGMSSMFGGSPFGGGYGGGRGGYGGYGSYGGGMSNLDSCGTGNICCDLACANLLCGCPGGGLFCI